MEALWNVTGVSWSHCGTLWGIMEVLWSHCEALQNIMEAFWSIAEHYGVVKRCGALQTSYGALRSITIHYIMECSRTLRDVTERYESVADGYGTLQERYGTIMENIDLPILN